MNMKRYIKTSCVFANATKTIGSNYVPSKDEILNGDATYGGLPVIYHPEIPSDARNMDSEIWVSDKFFTYSHSGQQHILNHEVAHNLSDELMNEHLGDWNEFASYFITEKQAPETSQAYKNGKRTYWEGLYGDIGATSLSETTTHAITEYLDNPNGLKRRSEEAYGIIDEFMTRRFNL
jgi:hypothetical protein